MFLCWIQLLFFLTGYRGADFVTLKLPWLPDTNMIFLKKVCGSLF